MPMPEASVSIVKGFVKLGKIKTVVEVNASFNLLKPSFAS